MSTRASIVLALLLGAGGCTTTPIDDPQAGFVDGEPFDERHDSPDLKSDLPRPYAIPEGLPELSSPEIIVSLGGLTVHLFDRDTGFSRVYPAGVGVLGGSGRSITPTGHFTTHADTGNGWFYMPVRWDPAYFEGYPFLRITAENRNGYNTYGLHGPITNPLERGYVSHGCVRMAKDDIVELFTLVRTHGSTPVTIQQEVERDANGDPVDVGVEPALYAPGERIAFGASVGPREPIRGFVGDACDTDAECGQFPGGEGTTCHEAGFCTRPCAGYCPDAASRAGTICVADPAAAEPSGICVSRSTSGNRECADVPGTVPAVATRFVGDSGAPSVEAVACVPTT